MDPHAGPGAGVPGPGPASGRQPVLARAFPSERAIGTLIGLLGDPNQPTRFAAHDALVRIGDTAVEPLGACLLRTTDRRVARTGLMVARRLADRRLTEPVLRLADHPSARLRSAAFRALGAVGGPGAVDRLVEGLDDPEEAPRTAAAAALSELGRVPADPRMAEALGDPAGEVRAVAHPARTRLGTTEDRLLRERASTGDDG